MREANSAGDAPAGARRLLAVSCLTLLCSLRAQPLAAQGAASVRDSVVKIYTVHASPDYYMPWSTLPPESSTSSGCIIAGNLILTNAHAVTDQTYIEVRRHGVAEKYPAQVKATSHTADLALLTVADPAFFRGAAPLELGELPEVQSEVTVYGFPTGGDSLSGTGGVISRIEDLHYAHSDTVLLAAQIDAAVNPGNSGGPVVSGGRVIGVVMQNMPAAENIGYMVPAPVIRHFLADIADGRHDGFPALGISWEPLENDSFRRKCGLREGETGIFVYEVIPGSPAEGALLPGDVLTAIDGLKIAGDGTVERRPGERASFGFVVQGRQIGETVAVQLVRGGKPVLLEITLTATAESLRLVPREEYDVRPSYYVYGGLVFQPLTRNYLMSWGDDWYGSSPARLLAIMDESRKARDEQVVLLMKVLSAEVNRGYNHAGVQRIVSVDGVPVRNLAELARLADRGDGSPFTVFRSDSGLTLAVDRGLAAATAADLLRRYRVPADRSDDLPRP